MQQGIDGCNGFVLLVIFLIRFGEFYIIGGKLPDAARFFKSPDGFGNSGIRQAPKHDLNSSSFKNIQAAQFKMPPAEYMPGFVVEGIIFKSAVNIFFYFFCGLYLFPAATR